jgi:hypothetical protein
MIDHCSFTCPCDENADLQFSSNITFSWCIFADGNRGCAGEPNQKAILGSSTHQQSCILNLFAHFNKRIPMYSNCYGGCVISSTHYEVVNNVLYNCGREESFYNCDGSYLNVVGNYLKSGLDNSYSASSPNAWISSGSPVQIYANGNYNPAFPSLAQTQFISGSPTYSQTAFQPQYTSPKTAQQAYQDVLAQAGALPHDSTDRRVVREVETTTGHLRELNTQEISQGRFFPREPLNLPSWTRPVDADNDGMADAWELLHGLSPSDNMDFRTTMNGGYEAIEVYINELADSLAAFGKWPAYLTAVESPSFGKRSMAFTAAPNPFKAKTRIVFAGGFGPEEKPDLQILGHRTGFNSALCLGAPKPARRDLYRPYEGERQDFHHAPVPVKIGHTGLSKPWSKLVFSYPVFMGPLRKYLKLAGLWIWRLFLAYAIVFAVAASIALVLLFRAAYAPVAKVKVLQTNNPKESVFMARARRTLHEAGRPDTLVQALVPLDSVSLRPFVHSQGLRVQRGLGKVHPGRQHHHPAAGQEFLFKQRKDL